MDNQYIMIGHTAMRDADGSLLPPVSLFVRRDDYELNITHEANNKLVHSTVDILKKEENKNERG